MAKAKTATKKAFWDKEQVLSLLPATTGKSAVRVASVEKDGKDFVDVRKFVGADFTQHTSSGISLDVTDVSQLHELIVTLQKVERAIKAKAKADAKKAV